MNKITKIVLSSCKTKCTVYRERGDNLEFDFKQLKMNYKDGIKAIQHLYGGDFYKANKKAA